MTGRRLVWGFEQMAMIDSGEVREEDGIEFMKLGESPSCRHPAQLFSSDAAAILPLPRWKDSQFGDTC